MSDRDANVRLNLEAAGFLSALRELEKHSKELEKAVEGVGTGAEKASRKTGALSSSMKAGFGAAKTSLAELGSTLKSTLAQAATLGGALSMGAGAKGATELISTYKDIAFAIQAGTGQATSWIEVQKNVEAVGEKWKQSNEKIAESFKRIYEDVGDAKYAAAAIDEVAKGATAGAGSIDNLTSVAGSLNEKFGITAKQLPDAMAAMIAMANKGGFTMEDFAGYLGNVGSAAKAVGIQGPEGLKRIVGMINVAEGSTKSLKGAAAGMSGLLMEFADPAKLKSIEKLTGLKLTDSKGKIKSDVMQEVLVKTKGDKEKLAALGFAGEGAKIMAQFGDMFEKAYKQTKGNEHAKTKAGLAAFDAAIADASKQTLSASQLQEEATARLKDPARQLDDAMNKFKKAFEKPEVVEAVNKLADSMPKLAKVLGDVVGFAADHPMLAGAAVLGGKPALSGLSSAGGELAGSIAKGAWKTAGAEFAATAAASGKWAATGKVMASVLGPALAAVLVFELGKAGIDKLEQEDAGNQNDLASARAGLGAAMANKDPAKIAAAQERLKGAISKAQADEGGVTGSLKRGFRGAASLFGDVPVDPQADAIARAEADLRGSQEPRGGKGGATGEGLAKLEKGLAGSSKAGDKAAGSLERAAASAERFAKTLDRAGGTGGASTNGLPPAPGNGSGSGAS